jgi:hypothetical protein
MVPWAVLPTCQWASRHPSVCLLSHSSLGVGLGYSFSRTIRHSAADSLCLLLRQSLQKQNPKTALLFWQFQATITSWHCYFDGFKLQLHPGSEKKLNILLRFYNLSQLCNFWEVQNEAVRNVQDIGFQHHGIILSLRSQPRDWDSTSRPWNLHLHWCACGASIHGVWGPHTWKRRARNAYQKFCSWKWHNPTLFR